MSTGTPITQTDQEKNERIAVLLGWERDVDRPPPFEPYSDDPESWSWYPEGWDFDLDEDDQAHLPDSHGSYGPPDFLNDWARFPDLQAYVRGLDWTLRSDIAGHVSLKYGSYLDGALDALLFITPRILADAILAVEEGAE